jgi:rubrerythrin
MHLNESQTLLNLAKSFAGEAQAGLRYQFTADLALEQGYKILSDEIRKLAKNEVNHAKVFFNAIVNNAGNLDNIEITAGYPFQGKTIEEGLRFAIKAELDEVQIYEKYSEIAEQEGFTEIAKKFKLISAVEKRHADVFENLHTGFTKDKLYKLSSPVFWICSECGHIETATEGWNVCPLCNSTQGFIELKL